MTSNTVLMLFLVYEKHEYPLGHKRHEKNSGSRWTGFATPSVTFQHTGRCAKPYGTGSKPVPASFVTARIVAIELGQTS